MKVWKVRHYLYLLIYLVSLVSSAPQRPLGACHANQGPSLQPHPLDSLREMPTTHGVKATNLDLTYLNL